jgi:hypothetical protein
VFRFGYGAGRAGHARKGELPARNVQRERERERELVVSVRMAAIRFAKTPTRLPNFGRRNYDYTRPPGFAIG